MPFSSNAQSQTTSQFLTSVLSQSQAGRPSSLLPYSEDVKWLIRQHLLSLTNSFPSLSPKTAVYTHNDGRSVTLLHVHGTVPMLFQGLTYNIPLVIWLIDSYPRHPPCIYLTPTPHMIIKRPHPHVNPSGLVSTPYLHNWIYPTSNLLDLARDLSHCFSRNPPLYSQPNPNPNPCVNKPNPNPNSNSASIALARPSIPPRLSSVIGRRIVPQLQNPGTDDPNEVFKRNAINKLVGMLHGDAVALRKQREDEMDGLFNAQATLRQREAQLEKGLKGMVGEKEALEQQLQMVLMNANVLQEWVIENEGKMVKSGNVVVDEAIEPCDSLSKQMLDCAASDLSIDDVIYSLDKAVQDGAIPFDQYLRNVRLLSREQFLDRATSNKVKAVQMQTRVASMVTRRG